MHIDKFVNNINFKHNKKSFKILNGDLAYDRNVCDLENVNADIQNTTYKVFQTLDDFCIVIGIFSRLVFDDMG